MRRLMLVLVLGTAVAAGTALAADGPLPGTKTPAHRATWKAKLHWPANCEQDWRSTPTMAKAYAGIRLSEESIDGLRLVEVTCYVAAYQETFLAYLVDPDGNVSGPNVVPVYIEGSNGKPKLTRDSLLLGVSSFSPASGRLTVFTKSRGPGDCGFLSTYKIRNGKLVATEFRAKLACDGKPPYDPARWPKLPVPR